MPKKALITGITGQDGAYLAALLVEKGYKVYGSRRGGANAGGQDWRMRALGVADEVELIDLDLLSLASVKRVLEHHGFDEIYNFAAQSFVASSFDHPLDTSEIGAMGATRLLESIRSARFPTRFYQASSSEMFGKVQQSPQTEDTPFQPCSPYGVAKLFAHWMCINYRASFGLFAASGILFNHESPLRGSEFVTRKITSTLARIRHGLQGEMKLGNLDARRDWGFAGDYVRGMHLMLQQDAPDDYLLATGASHSIREFASLACEVAGMPVEWQGAGPDEKAVDRRTGKTLISLDPALLRPAEVGLLVGNPARAREKLGWQPRVDFATLVAMMMEADLKRTADGATPH